MTTNRLRNPDSEFTGRTGLSMLLLARNWDRFLDYHGGPGGSRFFPACMDAPQEISTGGARRLACEDEISTLAWSRDREYCRFT